MNLNFYKILKTKLQTGNPEQVEKKRKKRIIEALEFKFGTKEQPKKHLITAINNIEVYFLKPGKEFFRKNNPNFNDMTPVISKEFLSYKPYSFEDIWSILSKISFQDFEIFRILLILIYRNAYLLDHEEVKQGIIRYKPNDHIDEVISKLDKYVNNIFQYGILGLLHFLDILGWNEDVKYHVSNGKPDFSNRTKWKNGRTNTLLSCINISYKMYHFVKNIIENYESIQKIDWFSIYKSINDISRGVCPPTQKNLLQWFPTYIYNYK